MSGMLKSDSAKTALSVVFVIAIAAAFWLALLSPKRDKSNELKAQAATLTTELASAEASANEALAAKKNYRSDYNKLLQLGKAVPADSSTSSLLAELSVLGYLSKTSFVSISKNGENGGAAPAEGEGESSALPPLGAQAGPSGLLAMPYSLEFAGGFFQVADFIHRLDSLVKTKNGAVDSHGRLITVDGFELTPANAEGSKEASELLGASFSVSTYVTPPGQGLTAGATAAGPAPASYEK
jgi:Tfp pilus assembly protein PilO